MMAAAGGEIDLYAQYQDGTGTAVNPGTPLITILDPFSVAVVEDVIPVYTGSPGRYTYHWEPVSLTPLGSYTAVWSGVINSAGVEAREVFQVVEAGDIIFPPEQDFNLTELRYRLGEQKTDLDGDGSETLFTDDQLEDMMLIAGDNVSKATYEGWKWKMARFARLIDITESGSNRNMSQKFKQAQAMVVFWKKTVDDEDGLAALAIGRVAGKAINLRDNGNCDKSNPYPFSGSSDYIRIFPSHRLLIYPAILS